MAAKKDKPWFRKLADGQLEIFLKSGQHKVRAHGPEADMYELVEWFEDKAGVKVQGDWKRPPRRGPRVLEGQTSLLEMAEVTEEQPEEPSELVDPDASPFRMPQGEGEVRSDCSPYGPLGPEPQRDMGTL